MKFSTNRPRRVITAAATAAVVAAIAFVSPASASAREVSAGKSSVTVVQQHGTAKPGTKAVNSWDW